ncbi:hypothetical protein [uncultured Nostoc sp.]
MSDRGQLMPAASAAQNVTLLVIVLHLSFCSRSAGAFNASFDADI